MRPIIEYTKLGIYDTAWRLIGYFSDFIVTYIGMWLTFECGLYVRAAYNYENTVWYYENLQSEVTFLQSVLILKARTKVELRNWPIFCLVNLDRSGSRSFQKLCKWEVGLPDYKWKTSQEKQGSVNLWQDFHFVCRVHFNSNYCLKIA